MFLPGFAYLSGSTVLLQHELYLLSQASQLHWIDMWFGSLLFFSLLLFAVTLSHVQVCVNVPGGSKRLCIMVEMRSSIWSEEIVLRPLRILLFWTEHRAVFWDGQFWTNLNFIRTRLIEWRQFTHKRDLVVSCYIQWFSSLMWQIAFFSFHFGLRE